MPRSTISLQVDAVTHVAVVFRLSAARAGEFGERNARPAKRLSDTLPRASERAVLRV